LFANMHLLFGDVARAWHVVLIDDYQSFLLAILPPGAFIVTGILIAIKNQLDARAKAQADAQKDAVTPGSKRVRVTGKIA